MRYKFLILLSLCLLVVSCMGPGRLESQSVERGRKLVLDMDCNSCHTPDYDSRPSVPEEDWLVGGDLGFYGPSGTVYPANLRLLVNRISEDEWVILARKLRKGMPMEAVLLPSAPEQDLRAIYRFVKYLGPKGEPAPKSLPAGVTPQTKYIEYPYLH
jgi:hypothetical protein